MKNIYLLLLSFCFAVVTNSQGVSAYSFSQSAGVYTPITGGTNLASLTSSYLDEQISALSPIGFTFRFAGIDYTQFSFNANGYIALGASANNITTNYAVLSTAGTPNNLIAAMNNDLVGRGAVLINRTSGSPTVTVTSGDISLINPGDAVSGTGLLTGAIVLSKTATTVTLSSGATSSGTASHMRFVGPNSGIRYETTGAAPNRKLVVQWTGFGRFTTSGAFGELYDFQVVLTETSNTIDVVYNIQGPSSTTANTYQVGLRGASNADFNNRTTTTNWAASAPGGTNAATMTLRNTVKPAPGLTYTWTPPNCTAPAISAPAIVPNCGSGQWSFTVDVTSLGSASSLSFSDATASPAVVTAVPATVTFGPYASGASSGAITVIHDLNPLCNAVITSQTYTCLPANDDCAGATAFPVIPNDGNCVTLSNQSTANATQSLAACAGGADDDVWYSFVAPTTSVVIELTTVSGSIDRVHQVFSGTCGSLTSVSCSDPETSIVTGLVVGNTYYVRVYTYLTAVSSVFNICIKTPPANDNCTGAIAFPVIPNNGNCVTLSNQSTAGATQSLAACIGSGADDDVWYSFVAPATSVIIELTYVSGSSDWVHQVFSGTCGSLTSVFCSDPETSTVSGLMVGNTYYIRVHTYVTASLSVFNICIKTPPPPPANDDCAGATAFPVIPNDGNCITLSNQSTASATQSQPACVGSGADDDVWYSFVAPASTVIIGLTNVGGSTDRVHQVFSGTCGSLTSIMCSDPETSTVTGLVTGNTYYVRVHTYLTGSSSVFNICIKTLPANDDAPGAITLALGACAGSPFTNANATQSAGEPFASCKGITGFGTVWYKFTAPASGAVKISNDYSGGTQGTDTRLALFSTTNVNDYTTFTIIACDDDNGSVVGTRSTFYATGLTAGNTYYIQADGFSNITTKGTFCLSVEEMTASMVSASSACATGQSLVDYNNNYNAWISSVDVNGRLIAQLRNTTGTGAGISTYDNGQNINAGAVRNNAGVYYLDRNYRHNNSSATNVDIQFFFLQSELSALVAANPATTIASLGAVRQGGTTCQANFSSANGATAFLPQTSNGVTADGNARWIQVTTPSFSNFYLQNGVGAVLPAGLLSFAGQKDGTINKLRWTTANEQNNRGFEIQRSADGVNYSAIGFVNTQAPGGNSTDALSYIFTDNNPAGAKQYYRLKQVDINNRSKMSNVVLIKGDKPVTLAIDGLYPNPANTQVNVLIGAPVRDKVTLTVTDMTGKTVLQKVVNVEAGSNTIPVDISRIINGSYLVKLVCSSNCENAVGKFVKQ